MKYAGSEVVEATPMTRLEYNEFRNWDLPEDENGSDEGYLIKTEGKANSELSDGYIRWLTKEQFDKTFRKENMSLGEAILMLKEGHRISRRGWNEKGMVLFLVPGSTFKVNRPPLLGIHEEGTEVNYQSHVDMITASGTVVPWLCSQTDLLANDYFIVE